MWICFFVVLGCFWHQAESSPAPNATNCSHECIDHYRNCAPEKINLTSDKPDEDIDCSLLKYQLKCPILCSICTPCFDTEVFVEIRNIWNLIENVTNITGFDLDDWDNGPMPKNFDRMAPPPMCDGCTQEIATLDDGTQFCVDKFHLTEWIAAPCPNYCGIGTTDETRKCFYFEWNEKGDCEEKESSDLNNPCDDAILRRTQSCFKKECYINMLSQKTNLTEGSGSSSEFYYKLFTYKDESCDLGKLGFPTSRQEGGYDVFFLNKPCNASMNEKESFEFVQVEMVGDDPWTVDEIDVTANGVLQSYLYGAEINSGHKVVEIKCGRQ